MTNRLPDDSADFSDNDDLFQIEDDPYVAQVVNAVHAMKEQMDELEAHPMMQTFRMFVEMARNGRAEDVVPGLLQAVEDYVAPERQALLFQMLETSRDELLQLQFQARSRRELKEVLDKKFPRDEAA